MKEVKGAGTIVEVNGEILLLLRKKDRREGNTWGLPAGGVESSETYKDAAIRELYEETGYNATPKKIKFVKEYKLALPEKKLIFQTYKITLQEKFEVKLKENEHQAYTWMTPQKILELENPIHLLKESIKDYYELKK